MKRIKIYCLLVITFVFFLLPDIVSAQIYINEFMASNSSGVTDPDFNNSSDWIELYNASPLHVNLGGYYLTDNLDEPQKWMIPEKTFIPAKTHLLFWADDKNMGLHLNFKLSAEGEAIALVSPDGTIMDEITFGEQITDISFGRQTDGGENWVFMKYSTPRSSNYQDSFEGIAAQPAVDIEGGFFNSPQTVTVTPASPGDEIRYTLDGSLPNKHSPLYSSGLYIENTAILRVRSFRTGFLGSYAVNNTYFIDAFKHDLPVISLTADSVLLYDEETGLFIDVDDDTEIPVGLEYYEPDGNRAFSINAGLALFGGYHRDNPLQSLEVQFRNKYGTGMVNYRFFKNNKREMFDSFNLRVKDWTNQGKGHWLGLLLSDPLQHSILQGEMDLEVSSYQPVVVYLNGDYRGIHNMLERQNEEYIEYYSGEDSDNLDIFRLNKVDLSGDTVNVHNGDTEHFANLVDYLNSNDISLPQSFEHVKSQVDMKSFVNYQIIENYYANIDWPDNNQKLWRPRRDGGKWRWIVYDLDFGFNSFKWITNDPVWEAWRKDMFSIAAGYRKSYIDPWACILFRKLETNPLFIEEFAQTYCHHMNTTFQPARLRHFVDSLKSNVENEMHRHIDRWSPYGGTTDFETWNNNFQKYYDFAELRTPHMWNILKNHFELNDTAFLVLTNHNKKGSVAVYNVKIKPEHFTGYYFKDLPVTLSATANPGYSFKEWKVHNVDGGYTSSTENPFQYIPASFNKIEAVYDVQKELVINEVAALNETIVTDEFDEYDDWIEIHNPNDFPVDAGGYYLTDNLNMIDKWQIPDGNPEITTIPAGGYLILWADDQEEQGILHTSFKLSSSGEEVGLARQIGSTLQLIDLLLFPALEVNISYGCKYDGQKEFDFFEMPTPGNANNLHSASFNTTDDNKLNVHVYPNPVKNNLFVEVEKTASFVSPGHIILYDLSGRVVKKTVFPGSNFQSTHKISMTNLDDGIYLLNIKIDGKNKTFKIVKTR